MVEHLTVSTQTQQNYQATFLTINAPRLCVGDLLTKNLIRMTKEELELKAKEFDSKLKRHPMSSEELQKVLCDFAESLRIHDVIGRSEQLPCDCNVKLAETTLQVYCPKCYKTHKMK